MHFLFFIFVAIHYLLKFKLKTPFQKHDRTIRNSMSFDRLHKNDSQYYPLYGTNPI